MKTTCDLTPDLDYKGRDKLVRANPPSLCLLHRVTSATAAAVINRQDESSFMSVSLSKETVIDAAATGDKEGAESQERGREERMMKQQQEESACERSW